MLASILEAAGLRTAAVGNIGVSLLDAVLGDEEYDVLAVELSSYQLHWAPSLRAHSAAVLNLAPDHLDWHGSMAAYVADKGRVYEGNLVACVYNAADPATEDLVREADVEEGCRAIGFTLNTPGPSQLGVVDGILVDRAFVANRQKQAQELAEVKDIDPPAPHNIANALAAAALARAFGVEPAAVRDGLRAFRPDPHRIEHVANVDGVAYVDDSKATNTHAAEASLAAYDPIVWIMRRPREGCHLRRAGDRGRRAAAGRRTDRPGPGTDPGSPHATRPRGPGGRPRPDRHWGDVRGGPRGGTARPAGRHRTDGPGLRLDGHVRQLQQAGRGVRGRGPRTRCRERLTGPASAHEQWRGQRRSPAEESSAGPRGGRSRATAAISRALAPPLLAGAATGPRRRSAPPSGSARPCGSRRPSVPRSKGRSTGGPRAPRGGCGGRTSGCAGPGTAR